MEQEIRNADLSDMMCDLLYLLGCGVNEKCLRRLISRHFRKHTTKTNADDVSILQGTF